MSLTLGGACASTKDGTAHADPGGGKGRIGSLGNDSTSSRFRATTIVHDLRIDHEQGSYT